MQNTHLIYCKYGSGHDVNICLVSTNAAYHCEHHTQINKAPSLCSALTNAFTLQQQLLLWQLYNTQVLIKS